jgi:hypothetical protein
MSNQHDSIAAFLSRWVAAERSGVPVALEGLLAGNFLAIGPLGFPLSKDEWLTRHATGDLRYDTFRLEEMRTREYGDVAVVTARQVAEGTYRGREVPPELRATLVLARQLGARRLAGIHYSFIAGTPGAPPLPGPPPDANSEAAPARRP